MVTDRSRAVPPPTPSLSSFEWLVLGEPCSVNGFTTAEIWHSLQESKLAPTRPGLQATLAKLKAIGLARSLSIETAPLWLRTSEGDLAYNWKKQPDPGPEPRDGETGNRKSPQPCDQFRPFRPAPGYCWCGWFRTEHAPESHPSGGVDCP